jgi:hypothetical protein
MNTSQVSLSQIQLEQLATMQSCLNQQVAGKVAGGANWRDQGWDFGVAIIDELMELKGHLGWKWWKDASLYKAGLTEANRKQVQLEVIDILHFGLSILIEQDGVYTTATGWHGKDPEYYIRNMIQDADVGHFSLFSWEAMATWSGLTTEEVMEIYIGKYALNQFRMNHGYSDGTYIKLWLIPDLSIKYQEDNWYLERAIKLIKIAGEQVTVERINTHLNCYYSTVQYKLNK